jgi:REP element-mobilizing transposase RayT
MRHRLYVHVTWTTRDRAPLITAKVAMVLARFLPAIAAEERAGVLAVGVVSTHVHLLLRLDPATVIARLMQRLKGGSAAVAQREGHSPAGEPLHWAKGYNLESVSPGSVPVVVHYLLRQPHRHPREAIAGWPPARPE